MTHNSLSAVLWEHTLFSSRMEGSCEVPCAEPYGRAEDIARLAEEVRKIAGPGPPPPAALSPPPRRREGRGRVYRGGISPGPGDYRPRVASVRRPLVEKRVFRPGLLRPERPRRPAAVRGRCPVGPPGRSGGRRV